MNTTPDTPENKNPLNRLYCANEEDLKQFNFKTSDFIPPNFLFGKREIIAKPRNNAPFAAKVTFKNQCLFQNKFKQWTFPSTDFTDPEEPVKSHWFNIQNYVLQDLKGAYEIAAIFDNRNFQYLPFANDKQRDNLILQIYSYRKTPNVDRRRELDLSFLEPKISESFYNQIKASFQQQNSEIMALSPLQMAIKEFNNQL